MKVSLEKYFNKIYLYFSILNSEDEEIFNNEECEYASKKRKKDHFRSDTNTQSKVIFLNTMMFYLLSMLICPIALAVIPFKMSSAVGMSASTASSVAY